MGASCTTPLVCDGQGAGREVQEAIQEAVETMEIEGVEVKDNLFEPMKAKYLQKQRPPAGCVVA